MADNDSNLTQAYLRQEADEGSARNKAVHEKFAAQRAAKKAGASGDAVVRDAGDKTKDKPASWRLGHTVGLVFLVALIAVVCVLFPRWASGETLGIGFETWRLGLWLLAMALIGGSFVLIGHGVIGLVNGCLIDNRNRLSLSRLQQFSWTVLVLSAFLTFAAFRTYANPNGDPLDVVVPTQVWELLGISTGSLAGAALIKNRKRNSPVDNDVVQEALGKTKKAMPSGPEGTEAQSLDAQGLLATKEKPQDASISDLFRGDEVGSAAQLELGKVQMFFFTLIVVFAYAINLGSIFYGPRGLPAGLPDVSEGMVVLLLISHLGFLGSKAVPASPTSRAT
jgi:hypothetical protein